MTEAYRIVFEVQHSPDHGKVDFTTIGYGISLEESTLDAAIHMAHSALQNRDYDDE
ncbi:hypothetical protein ACT3TB_11060 [Micrococcaceae sp. AOP34-BR2-30]